MSGFSLLPTKQVDVFILMTEERAGFSPNHLKSVKVGYGLLMGFSEAMLVCPSVGHIGWGGEKGRPAVSAAFGATCSEWKEATQHGSHSVMCPRWGHEIPQPALAGETPRCPLGSRSKPTGNAECQGLLSCCFCAHRRPWAEDAVWVSRPRGFMPFPLLPVFPHPAPLPSSPCVLSFSLSLSKQELRELTFLGWWMGYQTQP